MWFVAILFVPIILLFLFILISPLFQRRPKKQYETTITRYEEPVSRYETYTPSKQKLSAEVSDSLHREVKQYCSQHHITMSELVRRAVTDYMNTHS